MLMSSSSESGGSALGAGGEEAAGILEHAGQIMDATQVAEAAAMEAAKAEVWAPTAAFMDSLSWLVADYHMPWCASMGSRGRAKRMAAHATVRGCGSGLLQWAVAVQAGGIAAART